MGANFKLCLILYEHKTAQFDGSDVFVSNHCHVNVFGYLCAKPC